MRILIVDNEIVSIAKLKLIMKNFGDCETVENGQEAIAMFHNGHQNNEPFGLIMLEINLPDMDGIHVLSAVREAEKKLKIQQEQKAKILMVTSFRDKDRIVACIQSGCNDYIGKPFDIVVIRKKLARLGISEPVSQIEKNDIKNSIPPNTAQFLEDISSFLNRGEINLPSLPRIRIKFREMITTGAVFQHIANLLKKDVAISAELIRMSNSAYYRGFAENKSLEQAISRVGFAVTQQVVDELSGREFYTMKKKKYRSLIEKVWKHSIACAYASEITSNLLNIKLSADPFTMGLLHDIGKLALLQIIADMERRGKFEKEIQSHQLIHTMEENHCLFGARLLEKWKYAKIYIHSALHHDSLIPQEGEEEERKISKELLIVHFANRVAKSIGYDLNPDPQPDIDLEDVESAQQLKIKPIQIMQTKEAVIEEMRRASELFK
jgi:HD-like signal output (HDOD) protein/FixJ family two-component response regulator